MAQSRTGTSTTDHRAGRRPVLLPRGATATSEQLRELRRCYVGHAPGGPLPGDALPPLLLPFRDPARVRNDYPLVLARGVDQRAVAQPLGEFLTQLAQRASAQPRVVVDNLLRWERQVRALAALQPEGDALDTLRAAGARMVEELQLQPDVMQGLRDDLTAMLAAAPVVDLLPLSAETPLQLLLAAVGQRAERCRAAFARRAAERAEQLRALLQVEAQKDPQAREGKTLQQSLGGGSDRFLDAASLARSVGGHRGTQRRDPARRQRLQEALAVLEGHLSAAAPPAMVVVYDSAAAAPFATAPAAVVAHAAADVCGAAAGHYDEQVGALLETIRAMQVAELEARDAYDPARHDPLLQALRLTDCSAAEQHLLPVVVAVADAMTLVDRDIGALTRLLTSGRPVQVLATLTPAEDPAHEGEALPPFRFELGYLGVAYREAFVQQSTAARPGHLLDGFERALRGTRAGLHVVDSGLDGLGNEPPLGAFLYAGAAIEGRAHLLFHYDPEAGETFARRLDFAQNPAPDVDWPGSELSLEREDGGAETITLQFTYADFALLEPRLHDAFALVPDHLHSDELMPLAEFLADADAEARHLIPFVWIATGDAPATLQRAVVRRPLVAACRDRLRFLRTLQELAGVRNEHVREAVHRAREEAAASAERERQALQEAHEQALAAARDEAAGRAMQGLARMLLDLDPGLTTAAGLVGPTAKPASAAAPSTPAVAASASAGDGPAAATSAPTSEQVAVAPSAPADDDDEEEPWIETARCSTCNDCVNLNPLLFAYDENKQARIKDPRAGTYAQLVWAAEKCPARCIHPGKPLDPDEPGLEELVARAAPFNL